MNLPNQITISRLIIAITLFVMLSLVETFHASYQIFMDVCLGLFVVGALSDYLDGYIARKYKLFTTFGRLADPLVDKIIILGLFVFFVKLTPLVSPWMVVVMLSREMLVSSLRSYLESQGIAFGANWGGKIKMVIQCLCAGTILFYLGHWQKLEWAEWFLSIFIWITVFITIFSAISYLIKAYRLIKNKNLA